MARYSRNATTRTLTLVVKPDDDEPSFTSFFWRDVTGESWQFFGAGGGGTPLGPLTPEKIQTKVARMVETAEKNGYAVLVVGEYARPEGCDASCRSRWLGSETMSNPEDEDDGDDFDDGEEVDAELILPRQKRIFAPGDSPMSPPVSTTGPGELRFEEGISYVAPESGAPASPIFIPQGPRWTPPVDPTSGARRAIFDKAQARLHEVHEISRGSLDWTLARMFVRQHHYSHSLPNIQKAIIHGLFKNHDHYGQGPARREGLVGVAIYSMPGGKTVKLGDARRAEPVSILSVFPGGVDEALELSRFILLPDVPFGGESWFLARSRELLLRRGLRGFTSFSDPHEWYRYGVVIKPGHYGQIYKASGLAYLGQGKAGKVWFTGDFHAIPPQSISKIRTGKSGWINQVRRLVELGAKPPKSIDRFIRARMKVTGEKYEDAFVGISRGKVKPSHDEAELRAWTEEWLPKIGAFEMIVPGKHKFAFLVDPTREKELRRIRRSVSSAWSPRPWVEKPVGLPHFPGGREGAEDDTSIQKYGHRPPEKPPAPERGERVGNPMMNKP